MWNIYKVDIPRVKIEINGHTISDHFQETCSHNPIKKAQTEDSQKFHTLEHDQTQYILQLIKPETNTSIFQPRIETAAYLEHMFEQHGQIPQKNLIHELVTYLNQGAYIGQVFFLIHHSFSEHMLNQQEHLTKKSCTVSIKVINSHSLQLNIKHQFPVKALSSDGDLTNKVKYTINSEVSFLMSSKPNDIFSPISYSKIQIKLNKPKPLSRYFSNSKYEYTQNSHKFVIAVKNNINNIILRMSNFISPPHSAYLKSKTNYQVTKYYDQQDAHTYLDSTTYRETCALSTQKA